MTRKWLWWWTLVKVSLGIISRCSMCTFGTVSPFYVKFNVTTTLSHRWLNFHAAVESCRPVNLLTVLAPGIRHVYVGGLRSWPTAVSMPFGSGNTFHTTTKSQRSKPIWTCKWWYMQDVSFHSQYLCFVFQFIQFELVKINDTHFFFFFI